MRRAWILVACLGLATGLARADDSFVDMLTYNGFGTLGIARSITNQAEFVIDNQRVGATENFDYKTDSKLGVQATIAPLQWLSGTVQILSEVRDSSEFTTQMEWAYVKVQPLLDLTMRYGKMELPLFLASDSRYVGYANTWLRSPDAVYGEALYHSFEGGDVTYKHALGPYSITANAFVGAPNPESQLAGPGFAQLFTGHHMYGYNLTADLNILTVRASVMSLKFRTYADNSLLQEGTYNFYNVGTIYDRNNVMVQGEFTELRTGDPTDNVNGWYLLGGYRMNKWLPYAMYADSHQNRAANGAIPEINGPTASLGVRLDWFKSVDFKAQIDHVKGFDYGTPFINARPGFNNKTNVFSLVADFVF